MRLKHQSPEQYERDVSNDEASVLAREYMRRAIHGLRNVISDVRYGGIERLTDAVSSIDRQIELLVRAKAKLESTQWETVRVNEDIPF